MGDLRYNVQNGIVDPTRKAMVLQEFEHFRSIAPKRFLGKLFKKGYKDFSDIPQDGSFEGIIYDGKHPDDEGGYPIALDIINMAEHHDIISTYDDFNGQYTIRLYLPAEEENAANYIWVKFPFDEDHSITIYEDGSWRMDSY